MHIFYCGLHYNYYDPQRGESFEHCTFYPSLARLPGVTVTYLSFDRILEIGRKRWNEELLEKAKREKPDVLFAFMFSDEFEPQALAEMKRYTTSVAWFADDSWRFWNYSRIWAPRFTWVVTTYSWMPELYRKVGQPNVIRSQWAADTAVYKPTLNSQPSMSNPDVSFVGSWSKARQKLISALRRAGVEVHCYGAGWPYGRISEREMLAIFSQSKINLGLNPPPGYWNKNSLGRLFFRRSRDRIVFDPHLLRNLHSWFHRGVPQVKARHFEIPACGGFLMTSPADDLGSFYEIGKEIVVYDNLEDLVKKIRYYLVHKEERETIARAGYERTVREHSYIRRFGEIFQKIGVAMT